MKPGDKDQVMADFAGDRLALLVATTVIEVGGDVPAASVMVAIIALSSQGILCCMVKSSC